MFTKSTMTKKITPVISDSIDLGICGQLFKHNNAGKFYLGGEYFYVTDSHVFGKNEFSATKNGDEIMSDDTDIFAVPKTFKNGEGFPCHFIVTRSSMKKDRTVFFLRLVPSTVSHFGSDMGKVKKLAEMAIADGAETPYDPNINFSEDDDNTIEEKLEMNKFIADDLGVLHDANKSFRSISCHTSRSYTKHFITDDLMSAFMDTASEDIVDAVGAKGKVSIDDMDIINASDAKTTTAPTSTNDSNTQQPANNSNTQPNNSNQNKNNNNGNQKKNNKNAKPEMPAITTNAVDQAASFVENKANQAILDMLAASDC